MLSRRGVARRGEERRGEERRGEKRRGEARRGEARRGEARRGEERRDEAGRGEARRGEARRAMRGEARRDTERELARVNFSTRQNFSNQYLIRGADSGSTQRSPPPSLKSSHFTLLSPKMLTTRLQNLKLHSSPKPHIKSLRHFLNPLCTTTPESPELPSWVKFFDSNHPKPAASSPSSSDDDFVIPSLANWVETHNLNHPTKPPKPSTSDADETPSKASANLEAPLPIAGKRS
ncbi:hypothetical protein ACLB2K_041012 [Fragaria x ananassa]